MKITENVEEYLENIYVWEEEKGSQLLQINEIASRLDIAPPSAVQMLKRMEKAGLIEYVAREGVRLTDEGRALSRKILRNHRLIECLMKKTLNEDVDEEVVCGMEHHMTEDFANAICTLLDHPKSCPHGNNIPQGRCCQMP